VPLDVVPSAFSLAMAIRTKPRIAFQDPRAKAHPDKFRNGSDLRLGSVPL
jgi:hypothetical protein